MFGNFIYFILVLLIYLTYQPVEEPYFNGWESLGLAVVLALAYIWLTRLFFRRIQRNFEVVGYARLDQLFHGTLLRQSILAVLLFAADIYGLNLPAFLVDTPLLALSPTLQAILFLALFVAYLAIVWYFAHGAYRTLYRVSISRRSYVLSNIAFSVPVLIPWLVLSGVADLINALPYEWPRQLLATTGGQVTYFLVFLLAITIFGPLMIQKFWRCSPLEPGAFRNRIEAVCRRAGMQYADILYWPIFGGKMLTAGVMGLVRRFRYILVTPALLHLLEPEEIDAVIAHEIGHIKKKHLLFYLFFFVGFILLAGFTFNAVRFVSSYSETVFWLLNAGGLAQSSVQQIAVSLFFVCVFLFYFRYIFGYFMRNFERQADCYVYSVFDDSRGLISTLRKIASVSGQSEDRPNWHHFSIGQRIAYLEKCETDAGWIKRQDAKVCKSIAAFFAALALLAVVGYQFSFGTIGARADLDYLKLAVRKFPDNPFLYANLGDRYYAMQDYRASAHAYEQSLALEAANAYVLNNLAWLYATCEAPDVCQPERALALAQAAARLSDSHYVLDTLAESYYANGMYAQAVEAEKRALAKAGTSGERRMYAEQLERFSRALRQERIE